MRLARSLSRLNTRTTRHSGVASLLLRTAHTKTTLTVARSLAGFVLHHHAATTPFKVKVSTTAGARYFTSNTSDSKNTMETARIQQLVKQLNTTASDLKGTLEIALYPKGELALLYAHIDSLQDLKDSHTIGNLSAQLSAVNEFLMNLNDPSKQRKFDALVALVESYKTKTPLLYDLVVPFTKETGEERLTSDFKMG